jgi:hypothetical protein
LRLGDDVVPLDQALQRDDVDAFVVELLGSDVVLLLRKYRALHGPDVERCDLFGECLLPD